MVRLESNIYNKSNDGNVILGATIVIFNSENNEVERISVVDETELNRLRDELEAMDYIRFADGSSLSGRSIDSLLNNNDGSVLINATRFAGLSTDQYSKTGHTHDDRYFTESEINTKLNSHTHDNRYFTESEINTKLNGKANTSHTHGTWSHSSITNGTLYYNDALRICFLHYYKSNYNFTKAGDFTLPGTIPSGKRPKVAVPVACYNPNVNAIVQASGSIGAHASTAGTKTVNFSAMWPY